MSAIPWIGQDIVEFIWGGFSVNNATLNRFFALHFVLPFVLAALALMHLIALHDTAGLVFNFYSNIQATTNNYFKYFTHKVILLITIFIILFSICILWDTYKSDIINELCFLKSCLFILNLKPTIPLNVRIHNYSTKAKGVSLPIESRLHPNLNNFYDWFCGLADAECLFFRIRERAVEFEFKISLHLDDLAVILFIQKNLGIGKVDTSGMASFRVNKQQQSELLILIEIFEKFPLNSTKYLNYLDFKKALELYVLSKSALTKEEISKLKARMNSLRTDFTMPNSHKLRITPEWVLGFTEGFLLNNINVAKSPIYSENYRGFNYRHNNFAGASLWNNQMGLYNPYIHIFRNGSKYLGLQHRYFHHSLRSLLRGGGKRSFSLRCEAKQPNLSLVVWGTNLPSNVGSGRFTKQISNMIKFPPFEHSVIVGWLLSDGWLFIGNTNKNARLGFEQSSDSFEYLWYTFFILSHYCNSLPSYRTRTRLGKNLNSYVFSTRGLPCFTELYSLFYENKVKRVPENIYELLTPVALLHFVIGDGSWQRSGLIICTDSYTIQDVVRLVNVLIIRYRFECTVRYHTSTQPRIKERSMPLLRTIIRPHMPYMLHKLSKVVKARLQYTTFGGHTNQGCFSVQKIFPFSFSLTQKSNTDLMRAIANFFQSLAVRFNWPNEQEAVRISLDSRIGYKGDITSLHISRTDYLTLLIPFFDSLTRGSKKENDYNDWKTILQLKKLGLHYTEKGVTIINLIISQMNLNRSSTNAAKMSQPQLDALKDDIVKLLAGPSWGKKRRKNFHKVFKYYTGRGSIKVELQNKDGLVVNTFGSISECAKFGGGLAPLTVTTRLQKNMPIVLDDNVVFVKKRQKQDLVASKNLEPPGPKFIYKNPPTLGYSHLPLAPCDNDSESHKGLPSISTRLRREPPKAKLAFILPNFKPGKRIGPHNEDVISLLGGSLLGNSHAERQKNGGVRFIFKKSEAYKEYMFWLYEFFNKRGYCTNNLPVVCKHGGASCQSIYYSFVTHSFTSLIWLYKSFYNHKKQKKIPVNIADILTPLSLAVLISDKGFFHYPSLLIHTQNFSKQEVRLLSLALETKFNIKSTLWSERRGFALAHESRRSSSQIKSSYLLVIKVEHMPLLRKLLTPHMEPSMLYKLGL